MATQQQLTRKFRNISRVLTRCSNMKITFSGKGAWHSDGIINLPIGDFSNDEFVTMSIGYCDHELGHENYTSGDFYERAFHESPFLKGLLNSLDDAHQEARLIADFKGCKTSLRKLVVLCKEKGIFIKPSCEHNESLILRAWVLYGARSFNDQPLDEYYRFADDLLKQKFGDDFYRAIHKIFNSSVMLKLNSTEKCYDTAKQIYDLFMAWVDEQESNNNDSDDADGSDDSEDDLSDSDDADGTDDSEDDLSDSDDADGTDDSEDDLSDSDDADGTDDSEDDLSDSDDADGTDDSKDDLSDSDDAAGSDDSEDDLSDSDDADGSDDSENDLSDSDDADGSDDSVEHSKGSGSNTPARRKAEILDSLDDDSFDFHAQLREQIADLAKDFEGSFIKPMNVIPQNPVSIDQVGGFHVGETHKLVSGLKNPLKRIFHDQNYCKKSLDKKGATISSSRISTVVTGNKRIFERESIRRSPNAVISLLVDKSGSMGDADMRMANSVSYAMSAALDGIKGVKNMVGYYPSYLMNDSGCYIDEAHLEIVKTFDKKPKASNFNITGSGCTPTAQAVVSAIAYLVNRAEPRKLLFVITDGAPDNIEELKQSIAEANAVGVKVFGIGIRRDVQGFEDADFSVIQSEQDLIVALTKGLRHAFK
ncbi:hypothetical protein ACRN9G_18915 [Shewanella frigidimarina]|uniref:hypothetical protein n=1 Tax=Shewanella frigidimarina TaxID=56812 RepID=UPI003D7ABA01